MFVGFCTLSESVYLINDLSGHREAGPVAADNAVSDVEANKVVTSLSVSGGSGGDGADGTCGHAVVMFLTSLHILTELHFAVCIEVEFQVKDKFRWALCSGNAAPEGKHVVPEYMCVDLLNDEHGRYLDER